MDSELITNQLAGEIQDFVAAYIFEHNLTKMPTVQEKNVRVSNGMHKYFWIDNEPAGDIEHAYEIMIPNAASRYAARTNLRPNVAVLRFKVETVRDGGTVKNLARADYVRRSAIREVVEAT